MWNFSIKPKSMNIRIDAFNVSRSDNLLSSNSYCNKPYDCDELTFVRCNKYPDFKNFKVVKVLLLCSIGSNPILTISFNMLKVAKSVARVDYLAYINIC